MESFFLLGWYNGYRKSTDGTNWSEPAGSAFQSLRFVNGWFWGIAGSDIWRSADGANWESRGADLAGWFNSLTYGNGIYVAVGDSGAISSSAGDGKSWVTRLGNTISFHFKKVVYGNDRFLCTAGHLAYSSIDGENWQTNALRLSPHSIHFASGYVLLVGYNGLATSIDTSHWTVRDITPSFRFPAQDLRFDGSSVWMLLGHGLLQSDALSGAPLIVSQPVSRTNSAGDTVTFGIEVSGAGPFSYQWQKDGTIITAATNATLTLSAVTSGHAGVYTVVVSNAAGMLVSAPALLTVEEEDAPVISVQRLTAVAIAGKVGRTYRIEVSSVMGAGADWQTLTNVVLSASPYVFVDYDRGADSGFIGRG